MRRPLLTAMTCLLGACSTGDGSDVSGLPPTDIVVPTRYDVRVTVERVGPGCVVGGLTPGGTRAEAVVSQRGRRITWTQTDLISRATIAIGGHVCDADGAPGYIMRLRGVEEATVRDGDQSCMAQVQYPALPDPFVADKNRCVEQPDGTIGLQPDVCGRLDATFDGAIVFSGDGCEMQPTCQLRLRWQAEPIDGPCVDGQVPDATADVDGSNPEFGAPPLDGGTDGPQ